MNYSPEISPCDIVVSAHNGLDCIREFIESVRRCTGDVAWRLLVIDDFADSHTREFLRNASKADSRINLQRNETELGRITAQNQGLSMSATPFVCIMKSDVIVTDRWLGRLVACAGSDPRIALVTPLTNRASQISVPMAPGANFQTIDWVLERESRQRCFDVFTGEGYCMLLRRAALDEIGFFDGASGYCEESNLYMRLLAAGWRSVAATNVYIYRRGRASIGDRNSRRDENRSFLSKGRTRNERMHAKSLSAKPLESVRELFRTPTKWDPMPTAWETARKILAHWRKRKIVALAKESVRGSIRILRSRRQIADARSIARLTRPDRLRVTYVVDSLGISGGAFSIVQLVNELILLGIEARIVAVQRDSLIEQWTKCLSEPAIFGNHDELVSSFPESDIGIATHWITAGWLERAHAAGAVKTMAYFLQDYEVWFVPQDDAATIEKVRKTYRTIKHKIVKSDWLANMMTKEGYGTKKIRLGINTGIFYPRDVEPGSPPRVLAMARPTTSRRGFEYVIAALAEVKRQRPDAEIVLFGNRFLSSQRIPFAFRDEEVVTDFDYLSRLYSEADVFLDGSNYQGFGRCGLEAMACGASCVLTSVGGVNEYARHEENCLMVEPKQPGQFAEAILRLLNDGGLRQKLIQNGFETVLKFDHKREARETFAFFEKITAQQ